VILRDRRGHDRMVVGFVISAIATNVVSSNPAHGEVYSIQHYVIKFVNGWWFSTGTALSSTI
jgi:hypothetical protein